METVLGKWHCGSTSNPINGKKGTATAICGGPLSIANISFEKQLSNAQRRQLGVGPITDHEK